MAASRYVIDSAASFVKLGARSSLHEIGGKGTGLRGFFEGRFFGDRLDAGAGAKMHLEIPVAKLGSGNAVQDREMHAMIGSRSFPNIVAELVSASPHEGANDYAVSGSINIRGTTRSVKGRLNIRQRDGTVEIRGEKSIDVRQFGIEPPNWFVFEVYPDVVVSVHLIASLQT